jgi:predicted ribosomally synthesized peptide with SipW-like signal peptide
MKKKITAISLTIALLAIAIVGASLAYFTDTDNETNTFTVGGVEIDLIEQQRGADGLEDFEQDKVLMPIVGSAQGDKDEYGMPVAANYVDKIVTVENTDVSDAYVRAYFAIPSALDDGYETFNAGMNVLHFDFGNKPAEGGGFTTTYGVEWIWKHGEAWNYYETVIDGINYNVYFADYYQPLAAGETTERFVNGVYLDKSFDKKDDGYYAFGEKLTLDAGLLDEEGKIVAIDCPVYAVAVQAAGFDTVADAVDAAFGTQFNPFGGASGNWQ